MFVSESLNLERGIAGSLEAFLPGLGVRSTTPTTRPQRRGSGGQQRRLLQSVARIRCCRADVGNATFRVRRSELQFTSEGTQKSCPGCRACGHDAASIRLVGEHVKAPPEREDPDGIKELAAPRKLGSYHARTWTLCIRGRSNGKLQVAKGSKQRSCRGTRTRRIGGGGKAHILHFCACAATGGEF